TTPVCYLLPSRATTRPSTLSLHDALPIYLPLLVYASGTRSQRDRLEGVDRDLGRDLLGGRHECLCGRRVRRADDDGHAGVTARAHGLGNRHGSQERNPQVFGQALAAAASEEIAFASAAGAREVAHVLDEAEHRHRQLLVHL